MNEFTQGEHIPLVVEQCTEKEQNATIEGMDKIIEVWQAEKVGRVGRHKENLKNEISKFHRIENLKSQRKQRNPGR